MRRLLFAFALLVVAPTSASAQDLLRPAARQGYYLGGGIRQAAMFTDTDAAGNLGFMMGGAFALRAGQMVDDLIGFGLAITSGGGSNDDWTGGYGGLLLEVQLTPLSTDDFAIRGGVGIGGLFIGRADESMEREDDPSGTAGSLYTLGVSYDLFPFYDKGSSDTGGFAFTGFLEGMLLPGGSVTTGGVLLGLEITYWFGFQKNRLELPNAEAFVED